MTHSASHGSLMLAAVALVLAAGPLLAQGPAQGSGAKASGPRWAEQAEESLCLGSGMGRQLMTQQEWQAHRQEMRQMTPDERARYREEWHVKMRERAREKGIELPDRPCPPGGMGGGPGMGPGTGQGRGMGSGGGGMGPRGGRSK